MRVFVLRDDLGNVDRRMDSPRRREDIGECERFAKQILGALKDRGVGAVNGAKGDFPHGVSYGVVPATVSVATEKFSQHFSVMSHDITGEPATREIRRARMTLGRIALEILIGFVGVYAAFAMSAYKEQRDLADRRHQVKRALIAEILPIVALARTNGPGYLAFLARFDSTVEAGHPAPRAFTESVGLTDHVWEATKQGGGLNLIDVPTFVQLSAFYNLNSNMFAQYAQLRDFSMREIVPRADAGPSAFFRPGTRAVPSVFEDYRAALRRLSKMNASLVADGDSLVVRLARDTL